MPSTRLVPSLSLSSNSVRLILPISILIGIVIASAAQTEFAHHVSSDLKYDQPYFTFYLTHTTFTLIFPLHLLLLRFTSSIPTSAYINSIRHLLSEQLRLDPNPSLGSGSGHGATWREIALPWGKKVSWLTAFLSVPAICWYIAMTLSPPVDITAIYATSSFATYGASMILIGTPLSRVTVSSIALAFVGVVIISTDGMKSGEGNLGGRVLGDGIMLIGAIVLGLYEVIYKLALPEGHGGVSASESTLASDYTPLPTHVSPPSSPDDHTQDHDGSQFNIQAHHRSTFPHIPSDATPTPIELTPPLSRTTSNAVLLPRLNTNHNHSSQLNTHSYIHGESTLVPLPPALHANFLTSCIGVATFLLLWPPIMALDWMGFEEFRWPGSAGENGLEIWTSLAAVFWGGSLYNAGLMVLIGIWGPTTSSVANLLTIGLVALVDSLWLGQMPDFQTVLGVGMICIGFGVILWEGEG